MDAMSMRHSIYTRLTSSSSSLTRRTTSVDLGLSLLRDDRVFGVEDVDGTRLSLDVSLSRDPTSPFSLANARGGGVPSMGFGDDEEDAGSDGGAPTLRFGGRGTSGSTLAGV